MLVANVAAAPRPRVPLALAVAVAVLLATPAFAFRNAIVDFWSADPAPERVQLRFAEMRRVFAPAGRVVPENAREVTAITLNGDRLPLWVAPAEDGSFCWQWHHVGACPASAMQFGVISLQSEVAGIDWAAGVVRSPGTERIEVRYEDGAVADVPFVWVSPPIDAGFVLFDIPAEHEREGPRPVAFVALDGDGDELARQDFRYRPPGKAGSRQ
jgi:hypothetical protein